jgi:UDPglucose--hexose-1-phosphate uridylyltransferase
MPKDWCPFCPGSGKVPEQYDVYSYPNDFPALSVHPPQPELESLAMYEVEASYGACEVILFSSDHHATLYQLSIDHLVKLINLWAERFAVYAADPKIKYIFAFENRGPEVGVTMPHPHGQLYAYPFVPQKLRVELDSCREYYQQHGRDLLGDMNGQELAFGQRMLMENEGFLCYLPFFTDYPYGALIVSRKMTGNFTDFDEAQKRDLAAMLRDLTGAFDALFDRPFPYMMCLHQTPVNTEEYRDCAQYFRFHLEFYPPLRDANRIKYYAGSEMGAWAAANTRAVEETAEELRQALVKYRSLGV